MADYVIAWPTLGMALLVFGFAPGAVLRVILLIYPRGNPRRKELIGELYAVPRIERPFWVAEQFEVAIFEGLRGRLAARRIRRAAGRTESEIQSDLSGSLTSAHKPRASSPSAWMTSSLSPGYGGIEIADLAGDMVGVRDRKNPEGPVLRYSPAEWRAFLAGARDGEFDSE